MSVWIYWLIKVVWLALVPLTTHYTPTISSCCEILWINVGNLRVRLSPEKKPSFVAKQNESEACSASCTTAWRYSTSSQNSLRFTICFVDFVNNSCLNVNVNAKPLLRFVLVMHTRPFAVQVEPEFFFFNVYPMWHEFCVVFLHFAHVFVLFGMESIVARNLFGYVNCRLEEAHQHKIPFTYFLVESVFSICIVQKHTMLQCDWRLTADHYKAIAPSLLHGGCSLLADSTKLYKLYIHFQAFLFFTCVLHDLSSYCLF